jgi:hypothetical protein
MDKSIPEISVVNPSAKQLVISGLIYLLFHGKLGRWTSKMVSLIPNFK